MIYWMIFGCQEAQQNHAVTVYIDQDTPENQTDQTTTESVEDDRSFGDVLRNLDVGVLSEQDMAIAENFMADKVSSPVYCDDIWRVQLSADRVPIREPEMVWPHASVPDLLILSSGAHLIVYNDLRPDLFMDILREDPARFWRQGFLGYGGIGFSIDRFDGNGFVELLTVDLQFESLQLAVDPDLGYTRDGEIRLSWFGMTTDVLEDGFISPMQTEKPHRFYRSQQLDAWTFSEPFVAVSSSAGSTGGVDPSILSLAEGGEILYVGPLDHYAMGWHSTDLISWTDAPNVETDVSGATVDTTLRSDGIHEMFYMKNGFLGEFETISSLDGFQWDIGPYKLYSEEGAHNPTVDYDDEGKLWLYYNQWNEDCIADLENSMQ